MPAHLGGLGETFATLFTRERLLARVSPHVVVQCRRTGECAGAEATFERPVVVVGNHVSPQFCRVSKRQTAMTTLEWVVCLTWAYMKSQCRALCEPLLTLTAFPNSNLFVFHHVGVSRRSFVGRRCYG